MEMTVVDPGTEDVAGKITDGYAGHDKEGTIRIRRVLTTDELTGTPPEVMVLSPDYVMPYRSGAKPVKCGILLLPGDADAEIIDAGCIVTYGMSPKNTITFSSIGENVCVVALQRELLTAGGEMLEQQEFKVKSSLRPDILLAVAGALLILGQKLPELNH